MRVQRYTVSSYLILECIMLYIIYYVCVCVRVRVRVRACVCVCVALPLLPTGWGRRPPALRSRLLRSRRVPAPSARPRVSGTDAVRATVPDPTGSASLVSDQPRGNVVLHIFEVTTKLT